MSRLLTINYLLKAVTAVLAVVLVAVFALSAESAWQNRQTAERVRKIADINRHLFEGIQSLRVERGTVNSALLSADPASAGTSAAITRLRKTADTALEAVLVGVRSVPFPQRDKLANEIRAGLGKLKGIEPAIDAGLVQPRTSRAPDLSKQWMATVSPVLTPIEELSRALSGEVVLDDPFIAQQMTVKELAWATRDPAGIERLLVGAGLASGKGIDSATHQRITALAAARDQTWKLVRAMTSGAGTPAKLKSAIERALARPPELMQAIRDYADAIHPYRDGRSSERVLDAIDTFIARGAKNRRRKPLNLWRKLKIRRRIGYWGPA